MWSQAILVTTDFLTSFSIDHLRQCVLTLADFSRQVDDINISLSSIGSLWNVSDFIQSQRPDRTDRDFDDLWFFGIRELLACCIDSRAEVRSSATQTLYRSMELYGSTLDAKLWESCIWEIIFPLIDSLGAFSESDTDEDDDSSKWSDSKVLAVSSVGSLFSKFFLSNLTAVADSERIWKRLLTIFVSSFIAQNSHVSTSAAQALKEILSTWAAHPDDQPSPYEPYMTDTWAAWKEMGNEVVSRASSESGLTRFTQLSLQAFVGALPPLLLLSPSLWSISRLSELLFTLQSLMTYPCYDDTRSDIDSTTPLQGAILNALRLLNLDLPGSASFLLKDLSNLITLAYASTHPEQSSVPSFRRITYVAVSKEAMAMSLEIVQARKTDLDLFSSGAVGQLIKALTLPVSAFSVYKQCMNRSPNMDHQTYRLNLRFAPSCPLC